MQSGCLCASVYVSFRPSLCMSPHFHHFISRMNGDVLSGFYLKEPGVQTPPPFPSPPSS